MKKAPRGPAAVVRSIPAPTGGWNAREPLPEMAAEDAVILENMVPGSGGVTLRGGYQIFATGLGAAVKALMPYSPANGTPKLFAGTPSAVFDVSNAGPVGAAVASGFASGNWQSVNFANPAGAFMVAANGANTPQKYDGATWAAMTLATVAGYAYTLTASKLRSPFVFGQRLWFLEDGSMRAWYAPVNAIAAPGTIASPSNGLQVLDLSAIFSLGGSLVAAVDWTRDGGTGSADYLCFITSNGQVAIYSGYDPNSAPGQVGAMALVGVFRIPPPIGNRCVLRAGADVGVLTQQGVIPLSQDLPLALSQAETVAATDKIRDAFRLAYSAAPGMSGWEMAEYPRGGLLLVNVPLADGTRFEQYVMNTLTGAWCKFTGLPAITWGLSGSNVFFGTSGGTVCQYDIGNQDNGAAISATVLPAFSAFKLPSKKRMLLARPVFYGALTYSPPVSVRTEYDTTRVLLTQPVVALAESAWGSPWGSPWGANLGVSARWKGIRGVGQVVSVLVGILSANPFRLDRIDVTFETGGVL